ncbi:cytidylate kinase-like family protein [bacterium]|nr:MAG: cytidylate kinase-like family protein [bacterium]
MNQGRNNKQTSTYSGTNKAGIGGENAHQGVKAMKLNVTIARQLGCGGSDLGNSLASALGIRCIDREIISETAKQFQIQEQEVANREERVASFWERMLSGFVVGAPEAAYIAPPPTYMPTDREIFDAETEVLKKIATQEDCVIVGRAACHVLPPHPGTVNILLYAPLQFRVERAVKYHGQKNAEEARTVILDADNMRAKSISQMAGKDWMSPENYHICIDTSTLPFPQISQLLTDFVRAKTANLRG